MATIVTYNRGGQDAPFYQSSAGDFSGVASFSTDFLVDPGFTATDFGLIAAAGGVYGNTDGADFSSFIGGKFCYAAAAGNEFSFAIKAKLSARNSGDIASFGLADAATGALDAANANVCFKVTQGASAAADAILVSLDDGTTEYTLTLSDNPEGYDSTAYHVYGAHVKYDGNKTTVRWFIDGAEVASKVSTGTFAAAEAMGLAGYQGAETALLYLDWAGVACNVRD
jgi:hypothetical protein